MPRFRAFEPRRRLTAFALAVLLPWGAGCAQAPRASAASGPDPAAMSVEQLQEAQRANQARIESLIDAPLASRAGQCRVVGLGERACGGPARYVAYSVERTDEALLLRLVDRGKALDRALNQRLSRMSTCMALREPQPVLKDGRCTTGYPPGDQRAD